LSKPRVFISYRADDRDWATRLAHALISRSVDVWFDAMQLKPGDNFQKVLVQGLRESDVYALVIGQRGLTDPNVMFEVGVAAATERPLIPIILKSGSSPELLAKFAHIHQIRTDDIEEAADELKRVAEHFKRNA
jgi:nucleoside 2-deoxyribosyltransferase